jgi:hypothetical protein
MGHIIRMKDTHLPKMVFNAIPEGRRGVGKPRLRWLDDAEADINVLVVKIWRPKAQDRKEWLAIIREAKAKTKRAVKPEKKRKKVLVQCSISATCIIGEKSAEDGG